MGSLSIIGKESDSWPLCTLKAPFQLELFISFVFTLKMPWTIPKSRCCESEYSEFTSPDVEYHSEKAEKLSRLLCLLALLISETFWCMIFLEKSKSENFSKIKFCINTMFTSFTVKLIKLQHNFHFYQEDFSLTGSDYCIVNDCNNFSMHHSSLTESLY